MKASILFALAGTRMARNSVKECRTMRCSRLAETHAASAHVYGMSGRGTEA